MQQFIERSEFEEQLSALRLRLARESQLRAWLQQRVDSLALRVEALDTERGDILQRSSPKAGDSAESERLPHKFAVGDLVHVVELRRGGGHDDLIHSAHLSAAEAVLERDRLVASYAPNNCDSPELVVTTGTVKRVDVLANRVLELDAFLIV